MPSASKGFDKSTHKMVRLVLPLADHARLRKAAGAANEPMAHFAAAAVLEAVERAENNSEKSGKRR